MGFVGTLVKKFTGIPLIITTHGRDVYVDPEAGAVVPTLWYVRPFLRFALHQANRVIAVSRDCSHYAVKAGACSNKVAVIRNGVDIERFSPKEIDNEKIRQILGVSRSAKLILFVGSLAYYKGVDILIRSISDIVQNGNDIRVLIIGDGPEHDSLVGLRNSMGLEENIVFLGTLPNSELPRYYNECSVFVLPSRRESFGIAAIEAMACAKPVIGTKVGGLKEVIDDGKTGILVKPDNPKQLAEAIKRILNNDELATQLGDNAREKVLTDFNWDHIAQRTIEVYKQVLDR
jgi:glycosyltransferase involved in cell wall biosynthesis